MEFSIDDIHRIRREEYEKTKNMTDEERRAYTAEKAAPVIKRIEEIRAKKNQAS